MRLETEHAAIDLILSRLRLPDAARGDVEALVAELQVQLFAGAGGDFHVRYEDLGLYPSQGQMSEVHRVHDRVLGRHVAMKILPSGCGDAERQRSRFVQEARVGARLEHPSMVPVHDMGQDPMGRPYFTMSEVQGRSLAELIVDLRAADSAGQGQSAAGTWTGRRLIETLQRVAQAVGSAHARGVVHRDLKPQNVIVGDYGEVWVIDWGLARVVATSVLSADELPKELDVVGSVVGTPAYMSPEQRRGEVSLGPPTDVFSLGRILADILRVDETKGVHTPGPMVPTELQRIFARATAALPQDRYPHAQALAADLSGWLDGARRHEEAREMVAQAERLLPVIARTRAEGARQRAEAGDALSALPAWAPSSDKRGAWARDEEGRRLEAEAQRLEQEMVQRLLSAVGHAPDLSEGHAALAARYRIWHQEAETAGRLDEARRYEQHLRSHNRGAHAMYLLGDGTLSVNTDPPGAVAELYRFVEHERRLVPQLQRQLGLTPLRGVQLPMGSYVLLLHGGTGEAVRVPVLVRRCEEVTFESAIPMPEQNSLLGGFVYIPAGDALLGGDPLATNTWPERRVWVDAFAISRLPVTMAEYERFIGELYAEDPDAAWEASPHGTHGERLWQADPTDGFPHPPFIDAQGDQWMPEWPVFGIRYSDAVRYCEWLSQRTGFRCRLLREEEWEKAARGVDGRRFPWGDTFDPSFCKMGDSRPPTEKKPEPVGTFLSDSSPYGVLDMAGSIATWCDGWVDPVTGLRPVRGGAWSFPAANTRCARRKGVLPTTRSFAYGLRVAHDV